MVFYVLQLTCKKVCLTQRHPTWGSWTNALVHLYVRTTGTTVLDSGLGRWTLVAMERCQRSQFLVHSALFMSLRNCLFLPLNTDCPMNSHSTGTGLVHLLCLSSCLHCCFFKEGEKSWDVQWWTVKGGLYLGPLTRCVHSALNKRRKWLWCATGFTLAN